MTRHLLSLTYYLLSTILSSLLTNSKAAAAGSTLATNNNCINSVVRDTIETKSKVNKNNTLSSSFVHLKSLIFWEVRVVVEDKLTEWGWRMFVWAKMTLITTCTFLHQILDTDWHRRRYNKIIWWIMLWEYFYYLLKGKYEIIAIVNTQGIDKAKVTSHNK